MKSTRRHWEVYYSKHADIYEYYTFQSQIIELIQNKLGNLKRRRILEVGCGKGYESLQLSKLGAAVIAIDYSKEVIKLLLKQAVRQKSNLGICQADIGRLPFGNGYFDLVFSQGVLEHFQDPKEVLQEQHRVLRSNGLVIIEVPNKYNIYTVYKRVLMFLDKWAAGWETEYTYSSLNNLMEINGFQCIDCVGRDFFVLKFIRRAGKVLKLKEKPEGKLKKYIRHKIERNKFMLKFFLNVTVVGTKKNNLPEKGSEIKKKKILMISYRFPFPLIGGAQIRVYQIGRSLSEKYQVDLLALNEGKVNHKYLRDLENTFRKIISFPFNPIRFKLNAVRGLLSNEPLETYYFYFGKARRWIAEHYHEYDLTFCVDVRMAKYLKGIKTRKVIDFIDATSLYYERAAKRAPGLWRFIYGVESKRLLRYELRMIREFDKAFIISTSDKRYLTNCCGLVNDSLIVLPNGANEDLFSRLDNFKKKEENCLVFLGKMNYFANVDAVDYFARKVFPLIKEQIKDIKFIIVGISPAKGVIKLGKMEGIEVTGFVDDPYKYLEEAKVVVAPMKVAAGIQNKILEAMALGKTVVTTSLGAAGIAGGVDGKHFVIADTEEEMASKILDLIDDKSQRENIGRDARRLVKEKYRWSKIKKILLKEIGQII